MRGEEGLHVREHPVASKKRFDVAQSLEPNLGRVAHQGGRLGDQVFTILQVTDQEERRLLGVDDEVPWAPTRLLSFVGRRETETPPPRGEASSRVLLLLRFAQAAR